MANPVIAHAGLSDAAVLTAGSEVTTLPVQNLQLPKQRKVWRTAGLSNTYVIVDLLAAHPIGWIALLGHNLTAAATWQIRGATSVANLTAAPGYNVTTSVWPASGKPAEAWNGLPSIRNLIGTAQNFRYWRIDLIDAANPAGYLQAGRLIVAAAGPLHSLWQSPRQRLPGASMQRVDSGVLKQSASLQLDGTPGPTAQVFDLTIQFVTEDDMLNNAWEIDRLRTSGRDVMVCLDPAATTHLHRQTILGHMSELTQIVQTEGRFYAKRYRIQESPA